MGGVSRPSGTDSPSRDHMGAVASSVASTVVGMDGGWIEIQFVPLTN